MNKLLLCALCFFATMALAVWRGPDLAGMDPAIAPGNDFFAYTNGAWLKATEIPADRSSYGTGAILSDLTTQHVNELLQHLPEGATPGSEAQQLADTYASFMDEATIEAQGLKPLPPALKGIDAISNRPQLSAALGATLRADVDVLNNTNLYTGNLFGLWVAQDLNDPDRYSPFLLQGGLGMPDREYYLSAAPPMAAIRQQYQAHIAAVLGLAGLTDGSARAAKIVELETHMAQVHWTRVASEQIAAGNNHWSRPQFDSMAPGLNWQRFFAAAGLAKQRDFVVWQPSALIGLSKLTASESLEVWKD